MSGIRFKAFYIDVKDDKEDEFIEKINEVCNKYAKTKESVYFEYRCEG